MERKFCPRGRNLLALQGFISYYIYDFILFIFWGSEYVKVYLKNVGRGNAVWWRCRRYTRQVSAGFSVAAAVREVRHVMNLLCSFCFVRV